MMPGTSKQTSGERKPGVMPNNNTLPYILSLDSFYQEAICEQFDHSKDAKKTNIRFRPGFELESEAYEDSDIDDLDVDKALSEIKSMHDGTYAHNSADSTNSTVSLTSQIMSLLPSI
jgi:hypothetical protein